MGIKLSDDKPWARLRLTRREYEASRPWKRAGMSRALFEAMVLEVMTDELYDQLKLSADAERLIKSLFDAPCS